MFVACKQKGVCNLFVLCGVMLYGLCFVVRFSCLCVVFVLGVFVCFVCESLRDNVRFVFVSVFLMCLCVVCVLVC